MITFNYMKWYNFFSYGADNYLDLSEEPVRQLIAGNGAGKTSILLILEELLYGKNHKGIKKADLINRNVTSKELGGEVGFMKDKDKFVIKLTRSPSLKVILTSNGIDISAHTGAQTMKLIEEILGMSYTLFNQLVYLSTDSKLNFLTDTDTNRKKFLIQLFRLDKYLNAHDKFKLTTKNIDGDLRQLLGSSDTLNSLIARDLSTAEQKEETISDIPKSLSTVKKSILEADLSNIKQINSKIEKNNSYKDMLDKLDKSVLSIQIENPDPERVKANNSEAGSIKTKISNNRGRIAKINKLGDKCPTCFSTIDQEGITNLKLQASNRIKQLDAELEELHDIIEQDTIKSSEYYKQLDVSNEFERLTNIIDKDSVNELLDKSKIEQELREIRQKIAKRDTEIAEIKDFNTKATASNIAIDVAINNIERYKQELKGKEKELLDLQADLGVATTLKDIFSTKGLVSFKLQFLVLDLEKQINTYLAELSRGRFLVGFALTGDKLNVVINDNGKEISISALSTGELGVVEIATLLAVRKLMSSISGTTMNLLFLDEVISVLEDNNKEIVLDLLLKNDKNLNILVVSHGYQHPLVPKIGITKVDGISNIGVF